MALPRTKSHERQRAAEKDARVSKLRGKETTTMAAAALVSADKPLTEQQKLFVKYWAEGDSVPNAYARAGYNKQPSYAYRMVKMPNILAAYHEVKRKFEEAAQMSRKKVMDMLLESYEMAKLMAEPATMVSAAREVGKMCGYYEPTKQEIRLTVNGQVAVDRLNRMSDDDLLKMVLEGAPLLPGAPEMSEEGDHDQG